MRVEFGYLLPRLNQGQHFKTGIAEANNGIDRWNMQKELLEVRRWSYLIRHWAKQCKELEERIAHAELLIAEGRRFFTPENMEQLYLIVDGGDARATKFTLWDFEQSTGESLTEGQYKRRLTRKVS